MLRCSWKLQESPDPDLGEERCEAPIYHLSEHLAAPQSQRIDIVYKPYHGPLVWKPSLESVYPYMI